MNEITSLFGMIDPDWRPQAWLMLQVVIAMLLGGLIGWEREYANKPAGFRTHMLVAGAACLLVGLGDVLVERFSQNPGAAEYLRTDPIRIVEAIITGLSFIGAGTIILRKDENKVEGLTTAASFLLSAGIGLAVALDQYVLGVGVSLLSLLVLRVMARLERRIHDAGYQRRKGP